MTTAALLPNPKSRFFDSTGAPLAGGYVYTYESGSTTPKTSYMSSDASMGNANTNPVQLDANGEADIWINGLYKIKLTNSTGTQQWIVDNVQSPAVVSTAMMPFIQSATIPAAQTALALGPYTFRNILLNGDMSISQRDTSFANKTALTQTLDGWFFWPFATGTATVSQQTGGLAADGYTYPYVLRLQRPNGNAQTSALAVGQIIQSADCNRLTGQNCYLSFLARTGTQQLTRTLTIQVFQGTGTDQGSSSLTAVTWTAQTYALNTTQLINAALTRYSFPLSIFTTTNEIAVTFSFTPIGTAGTSDYVDITGVQLEPLSLSNYEFMPKATQLFRCLQFYHKTFPYATVPAQNAGVAGSLLCVSQAVTTFGSSFDFPVSMFKTPTVTTFNPSAANANWRDATNGADRVVTVSNTNTERMQITGAAGAVGATNVIHYTLEAAI